MEDDLIDGIVRQFGPNVTKINLSRNGLRGLGHIEKISPCLEKLNLSQNDLVDIRPLGGLTTLIDLNISENNITDVAALTSLTLLQNLNLSGNNISSATALAALSPHLTQLKSLHLDGNPLCNTLGYPYPILSLFPSLETLDGVVRSSATMNQTVSAPSSSIAVLHPAADNTAALRAQLETMERAFEMQERALTGSGADAARKMAAAVSAENMDAFDLPDFNTQVETFPYLKLLTLWRKKAMESMTQLAVTQKHLQQSLATLKDDRSKHGQQMKAQQLTALSYKEKGCATDEKAAFLQSKLDETESKLFQEVRYRAIVDRERQDGQCKLRELRSFLDKSKGQIEEEAVSAMLRVDQAARRLKAYESRLLIATERVQFAAALVAQKEVVQRNTAAAMEAGRRIQYVEKTDPTDDAADENEEDADRDALLSDMTLRPEVESLLRTIFRKLDQGDSGSVPVKVLLTYIAGSEEQSGDSSNAVRDAMGLTQWKQLLSGLRAAPERSDMTWGEFLLLLLPTIQEKLVALRPSELEDLRLAGLWGDAEWGMIPLALPKDFPLAPHVEGSSSSTQQIAEIRRLQTERKYLFERVQEMSRTLERRAEAIKGHFEQELRRGRLKESRLQSQVSELKTGLDLAEKRLHNAAESHTSIHKTATERIAALEQELSECRELVNSRRNTESRAMEATLVEEKAKFARLETEHHLLQRELGKKDIKSKGLQRDVMRLQAQVAHLAEDKARLVQEAEHEKVDQAAEIKGLKELWASEKKSLETRITELESAAQTSEAAPEPLPQPVPLGRTEAPRGTDEFENVRRQMQLIREEAEVAGRNKASAEAGQEQLRSIVSAGGMGQSDVYAAHLNKLLRLAEEAISKN